jgi:hypothetical protein
MLGSSETGSERWPMTSGANNAKLLSRLGTATHNCFDFPGVTGVNLVSTTTTHRARTITATSTGACSLRSTLANLSSLVPLSRREIRETGAVHLLSMPSPSGPSDDSSLTDTKYGLMDARCDTVRLPTQSTHGTSRRYSGIANSVQLQFMVRS